jgi:hypothetical protein
VCARRFEDSVPGWWQLALGDGGQRAETLVEQRLGQGLLAREPPVHGANAHAALAGHVVQGRVQAAPGSAGLMGSSSHAEIKSPHDAIVGTGTGELISRLAGIHVR